jgi:hypothetical protein
MKTNEPTKQETQLRIVTKSSREIAGGRDDFSAPIREQSPTGAVPFRPRHLTADYADKGGR